MIELVLKMIDALIVRSDSVIELVVKMSNALSVPSDMYERACS